MSSISSSSDRSRQDEKVRQTREEYENRENENVKRRRAEIKNLEKRHNDSLQEITENYENRIAELKERNREALTQKDFENNRKIDEVRQTYRESIRSKMEEAHANQAEQRNSYEGALNKQRDISESQKANIREKMGNEMAKQDERFAEMAKENQRLSQETVRNVTRKLNTAHEKERDGLIGGFLDAKESSDREAREIRRGYEARLRETERQKEADNVRWSQKYTDTMINKDQEYSDSIQMKQMIMNSERDDLRDKYENALSEKREDMDHQNEVFRDSVNERLNSQVRSRDSQIYRLNSKLNNEISKNERLRGIERRNLTKAYEKRMDLLEDQKEDAIDRMKDINNERIGKVLNENSKLLRSADREARSQMIVANSRHREERENLAQQHKDQVTQVSNNAEGRVQKILDLSNKNQNVLDKYYAESLDKVKSNYLNRMDSYRDKTVADQVATNKVMTERFRNMEATFNSRLEQTVKNYEDKIAQLKDSQDRELKRIEGVNSQRTDDREKAIKMQQESLAMKYEAKIAQLNESHKDQLDRMNRRHEEDMQSLSVKMSSYSRKA
ncbi:hypothetical protein [Bdellovibrio bacteriovorus]|uniref:hypothetical protein n=1 Tax=Bdellovibrio TaxID=958 RepID=UPI0035A8C274